METLRILPSYTYEDYVQWQGKWELIEGIPFAMSPAPKPKHQHIVSAISAEFHFALKSYKACNVYSPLDYKISEETILQPDLLIVCGSIDTVFLDRAPELIVEVLSPSTASKDKLYKLNVYQQEGVPYYLVVDVDKETIQILQLQDGKYEFVVTNGHSFEFNFSFSENCEVTIDFNEIWS